MLQRPLPTVRIKARLLSDPQGPDTWPLGTSLAYTIPCPLSEPQSFCPSTPSSFWPPGFGTCSFLYLEHCCCPCIVCGLLTSGPNFEIFLLLRSLNLPKQEPPPTQPIILSFSSYITIGYYFVVSLVFACQLLEGRAHSRYSINFCCMEK